MKAQPRPWRTIALAALAFAVTMAGQGYLTVVAPGIETSTGAGVGDGVWLFVVYFVVAATTLLPMARLADRIGPRRAITVAMLLSVLGDVIALVSSDFAVVLISRVIAGLALGATAPFAWGLGSDLTRTRRSRRVTFSLLTGAIGGGTITGTLLGGVWDGASTPRWGFGVFALVALAVAVAGLFVMPHRAPGPAAARGPDYGGTLLFVVAAGLLLFGLKVGSAWGWNAPSRLGWWPLPATATVLVGVAVTVVLVLHQRARLRRGRTVVLPVRLFRIRIYAIGVLGFGLLHLVYGGQATLVPTLLHFTGPSQPGQIALIAALLPLGVMAGSLLRPWLGAAIGDGWTLVACGVTGTVLSLWQVVDPIGAHPLWHFGISNAVLGTVFGLALGVYGDTGLAPVPDADSSTGASMFHTVGNTCVGIGAMLFAIFLTAPGVSLLERGTELADLTPAQAQQVLDAAQLRAVPLPERDDLLREVLQLGLTQQAHPDEAERIRADLQAGYAHGWRAVAGVSGGAMVLVGLTGLRVRRTRDAATGPGPAGGSRRTRSPGTPGSPA